MTLDTTAMAPPATKRRKLEHSDSEGESDGSFAGFDEASDAASDASIGAEEDDGGGSDVSISGVEGFEDLKEGSGLEDDESGEEDVEEEEENDKKPAPAVKATSFPKPVKRPASSLQDGVYTAESFKSNMFKLQVDELLEQVGLRYGKKEAAAETAMRTLKNIIEHIPNRDALPVCIGHSNNLCLQSSDRV
jgi:U3 small nucleolar RNA-associated protein 22